MDEGRTWRAAEQPANSIARTARKTDDDDEHEHEHEDKDEMGYD